MLATQLKYDLLMFCREIFFMIFLVIVPPVSYLFMGQLYGNVTYNGGLSYGATYTPSFILLIAFGVIFFTFGFEQVTHRFAGIEKRILLTPVPKRLLMVSAIIKSIILTSLGYFLVYIIGMFVYDLSFDLLIFMTAYLFFIAMNAVLLVFSTAIYSFFTKQNSALVFSVVIFQVVMLSGGFTMPVNMMPTFMQTIANLNVIYHMNQLFIAIWNGQLEWTNETSISFGFIAIIFLSSLLILRLRRTK